MIRKDRIMQSPTHIWIARERACGCCTGLASDEPSLAAEVAEFIKSGRAVDRVTRIEFEEIRNELTFMACPHLKEVEQLSLC